MRQSRAATAILVLLTAMLAAPSGALAAAASVQAGVDPAAETAAGDSRINLQYLGHSAWVLTASGGTRIVIDPIDTRAGNAWGFRYPTRAVPADAVTVSHEHSDHNYVAMVSGSPRLIRGLSEGRAVVRTETVGAVQVTTIPTRHYGGATDDGRGENAVFRFQVGQLRIIHLGDLGHVLSAEQVAAIGRPEILLVPVGGVFTLDLAQVDAVIAQLRPRVVIPMHYETDRSAVGIGGVEPFLRRWPAARRLANSSLTVSAADLPAATEVWYVPPGAYSPPVSGPALTPPAPGPVPATPARMPQDPAGIQVVLDGRPVSFDVPPQIASGRTLVPLRALFEALGASVAWDGTTRTVTAVRGDTRIALAIGSATASVEGCLNCTQLRRTEVTLDVPAQIVAGRTLVPLRFVSEALGAQVDWDPMGRVITITTPTGPVPAPPPPAGGGVPAPAAGTAQPVLRLTATSPGTVLVMALPGVGSGDSITVEFAAPGE